MSTRPLSYLPQPLHVQREGATVFMFDASFCSLPLYFSLKGKHDYQMVNREAFVADVARVVADVAKDFDIVLFPESRYPFMRQITAGLQNATEVRKRSKADICSLAATTPTWKKQDRLSAEKAWAEMGDDFTINKIKANQRKYYVPHLFEPVPVPAGARVLLLDDFVMSGRTIEAMAVASSQTDYATFGVFYQKDCKA